MKGQRWLVAFQLGTGRWQVACAITSIDNAKQFANVARCIAMPSLARKTVRTSGSFKVIQGYCASKIGARFSGRHAPSVPRSLFNPATETLDHL
jgi:hypothetical protein